MRVGPMLGPRAALTRVLRSARMGAFLAVELQVAVVIPAEEGSCRMAACLLSLVRISAL